MHRRRSLLSGEGDVLTISLRPSTQGDRGTLWQIRTRAIRETCRSHYNERDLERWYTAEMPDEFGVATESRKYLVVEAEGTVAGFGMLDLERGEVAAVFVRPDFLRRGIGSKLLYGLESSARRRGLGKVTLSSTLNAVDFYLAAGFQALGTGTFRHPDGFELDCVLMEKVLDTRVELEC